MVSISIINVIRLLMVMFEVANNNNGPLVNTNEIELHDIIKSILFDAQRETSFLLETDTTLEFLQPHRPHFLEFVDKVNAPTGKEALEAIEAEEEECTPEGGIVTLEYKTNAVTYWKSGKKKRLALNTVQQKFRKISFMQQLYRWEEGIDGDESYLKFINSYIMNL